MTLWAENTEGMHNLFRLSSLSSLEGYYHKPRFDRELLERYGTGLIGTTGCPSGEVNRWLQAGNYDRALAAAADYRDILGAGNYFCELMDHGLGIERRFREDLLRIARTLDLPLIATNDLHYVHAVRRRHPRRAAVHRHPHDHGRPEALPLRRPRLLPQVGAPRCAQVWSRAARGLRQHPAHRRALPRRVQRGRQPHAARSPCPRGRARSPGSSRRSSVGLAAPLPGRRARRRPRAGRVRGRRHHPDGLPRATSSSPPTSCATRRRTASGSARAAGRRPAR